MTETRFRQILALYGVLLVAGIVASFVPGGYSQALADAYASEPEPKLSQNTWLLVGIVVPMLAAVLAGYIGMFFFKRWARSLSLLTTLAGIVLILFVGPTLSSAVEDTLFEASSLLWGGALALAYFSPVSVRFGANNSFKPKPLRGSA